MRVGGGRDLVWFLGKGQIIHGLLLLPHNKFLDSQTDFCQWGHVWDVSRFVDGQGPPVAGPTGVHNGATDALSRLLFQPKNWLVSRTGWRRRRKGRNFIFVENLETLT